MSEINTSRFVDSLIKQGIKEVVGVPCSTMTYLINELTNRSMYTSYENEGDAVSYAAGRNLEGVEVAVILQNSGLTNASSPISSLTSLYNIPMLYFVGYRGKPGTKDEPQHAIIGPNTERLITTIAPESRTIDVSSFDAFKDIDNSRQTFVLVEKGSFSKVINAHSCFDDDYNQPSRLDVVKFVHEFSKIHKDVLVLTTTGFTSRELLSFGEDFNRNFYMFGSMGCLISFATGVARKYPEKKVIVIDGDGSALMRFEGSFTPFKYNQSNLLRIIINNKTYQSTGGQLINKIDLSYLDSISSPCYYFDLLKEIIERWYREEFSRYRRYALNNQVNFIVSQDVTSSSTLPRPKLSPEEIKRNFISGANERVYCK